MVQPTLVVLEATGGLEVPVTGALAEAGLRVVVVNPRHARDFAKRLGGWLRRIPSMQGGWRILQRGCGRRRGTCQRLRRKR